MRGANLTMPDTFDATIFSFLAVEGVFALCGDPCGGFIPALIAGVIGFRYAYKAEQIENEKTDHPPAHSYNLPMPMMFAQLKKILKIFRYGERRWNVVHAERSTYSLTAISEWKEDNEDGDPYFQQVFLDISLVRNQEKDLTDLVINWSISATGSRLHCELLQAYTTFTIATSLREAEAMRAASLASSSYLSGDDED